MTEEVRSREEQIVVFELSGQIYGVGIADVWEIIRMEKITRVPKAPEFVEGIINLRGRIVPIIDLRKRFHLPEGEQTKSSRIIIVQVGEMTVGMIVDAVHEVLSVSMDSMKPPPPVVGGVDAEFLRGIVLRDDRLIIMLNLDKVLQKDEQEQLRETQDILKRAAQ
ncbi:MAG: chemotaxis protein CheW [Peptococcaceae bacterium]|nr:chemotaxis protein CheW [Peptococcaceae bacterium]